MQWVDPYMPDPRSLGASFARSLGASAVIHLVLGAAIFTFASARLLGKEPITEPPPRVVEVSLVAALPREVQKRLPDKVTSVQPSAPEDPLVPTLPELQKLPDPPDPADPEEKKPEEKKPTEEPVPEDKPPADLQSTLDRLASLKNRLRTETQETPIPGAAPGLKNRPAVDPEGASVGTRGEVKSYKADTPEGRYLAQIKAKVQEKWIDNPRLRQEQPDLLVIIEVTITPEGRLLLPAVPEEAIAQSSGNVTFDQSALRAVRMAAREGSFDTPPETLSGETVGFRFSPSGLGR